MTQKERASIIVAEWLGAEAGEPPDDFDRLEERIAAAIAAAVKEEREECIKIVAAYPNNPPFGEDWCGSGQIGATQISVARDILAAIRERAP